MSSLPWLVISYNLPSEPSRYRVATWRALKRLGAVNVQQSMWVIPHSKENAAALEALSAEIKAVQGEVLLMESVFFRPHDEERVVELYNAMRDAEYAEFVSESAKYMKEIQKEISREKFIYAELEEEEAEYEKLSAWYSRIAVRDIHAAPGGAAARKMTKSIKKAIEDFGEMVYAHETEESK